MSYRCNMFFYEREKSVGCTLLVPSSLSHPPWRHSSSSWSRADARSQPLLLPRWSEHRRLVCLCENKVWKYETLLIHKHITLFGLTWSATDISEGEKKHCGSHTCWVHRLHPAPGCLCLDSHPSDHHLPQPADRACKAPLWASYTTDDSRTTKRNREQSL